jgi:hypothetical protein
MLKYNINARYVGVIPLEWNRYPVLRMGVIAIKSDTYTKMQFEGSGCCIFRSTETTMVQSKMANWETCILQCKNSDSCVAADTAKILDAYTCRMHYRANQLMNLPTDLEVGCGNSNNERKCYRKMISDRSYFPPTIMTQNAKSANSVTTTHCASADHVSTTAILNCPTDMYISSIEFASFGDPSGQCNSYSEGSCHSTTSRTVVEEQCLFKKSCNVLANTDKFGNTCFTDTGIRLAVQFNCTTEAVLEASSSSDCEGKTGYVACFKTPEESAIGTEVGSLSATDPDANDELAFTILNGNLLDAFSLNSKSGKLMVEKDFLNHEDFSTKGEYKIQVQVKDSRGLYASGMVLIEIEDIN